jgi:hypothetical protein
VSTCLDETESEGVHTPYCKVYLLRGLVSFAGAWEIYLPRYLRIWISKAWLLVNGAYCVELIFAYRTPYLCLKAPRSPPGDTYTNAKTVFTPGLS